MAHAEFVHFRVHSAYSLLSGAIQVKELVGLCKYLDMPAAAICDSGNLFGGLQFSMAAASAGVQPIIGCQINVKRADENGCWPLRDGRPAMLDILPLYAQNAQGYDNLIKLVSHAYLAGDAGQAPHIALEDIEGATEGLVALTGGHAGAIGRLLLEGRKSQAEAALATLKRLFPDRLYVEVARQGLPDQMRCEEDSIALAYAHDIPLIATNEAFFADESMFEAHDALMCISQGAYVHDGARDRLTPEFRFKSAQEMRALFEDLPEAVDNSLVLARRCAVMVEQRKPILPTCPKIRGESEPGALRRMAVEGLNERLALNVYGPHMDEDEKRTVTQPYRERLDRELSIVVDMGFSGYFLIVADFIQWAKRQGIPVGPGRGSGASSLVAWALTITDLDPMRFNLLFERFLNPERVSMPDFDIDFCQDRRDEVIRYVQGEYGADRVAQIITFGRLQARAALRDVGRVLQMPYPVVDRICKLVPNNPAQPVTLEKALETEPLLQEVRKTDETHEKLIEIALKLEGLYRNASTHAAGVVIGDRPLDALVPLYRDPRAAMPATQFNMKDVEKAGLVKFDFLGLKTLTVLAKAKEMVDRAGGTPIDLSNLPLDDRKTFEMLARAETVGVFQMESPGMRNVLRDLKADRFEDLIAVVALYRPGPMDNIPSYIERKHGRETPDYLHPRLEPILRETYGIMIYQEQVMQVAQELSGYTLGGADLLRQAMGKKNQAAVDAQREEFVKGAEKNGVAKAKASSIFDQMAKFGGYGFNKAHAAAYALVAYQTAYLKANHPVEFMAASMTLDAGNPDKLSLFRGEANRLGIEVRPPDMNKSDVDFAVERDSDETPPTIRYALAAVRNVGRQAMRGLIAERRANGAFRSLTDFVNRIDAGQVNKRALENLILGGALDGLNPNRRQMFEASETIMRRAAAALNERNSNQSNLFGDVGDAADSIALRPTPDWPATDRLNQELSAIGFYLSAHPLESQREALQARDVQMVADLRKSDAGGSAKVAGIVVNLQERISTRGNRFAFLSLSDPTDAFDVTLFSETLGQARRLLEPGMPVVLTVSIERRDDDLRLTAQKIQSLHEESARPSLGVRIYLDDVAPIESLRTRLEAEKGGKGRVIVIADMADRSGEPPTRAAEIDLGQTFHLSDAVRAAIKAIPGIVDIQDF